MTRYLFLTIVVFAAGCSQAPERPTQVEDQGLLVTLSTPRTEYLLGEPVMVELLLLNKTEHVIEVPGDYTGRGVNPDIRFVLSLNGKSAKRVDLTRLDFDEYIWRLEPGQVFKHNMDLLGDRHGLRWFFDKPGAYLIETFFRVKSKEVRREVRCNAVEVWVNEPALST